MFNFQSLMIVMFLISLPVVTSRECYQCLSSLSWKDCDDNRIKVQCIASNQCVKAMARGQSSTDTGYAKGCAATCSASDIEICTKAGYKCEVDCCSSDYCNGAPGRMVSGLLLMVATGVVYLFGY
ncbi:hypothetical protein ACROYT_G007848 [Oculina patagonica]